MAHDADSPCAEVKRMELKRLAILTAEMESSSDESDGNCGYDPDSESDDQNESSRTLKSKYLDSPESLRDAATFVQPSLSNSPPTAKSRIRAPSVINLEQLLGNDKKNTTEVMASTMIEGQQCEDSLDFVPDTSSLNGRDKSNHHQITSALKEMSNVIGAKDQQLNNSEGKKKMETESFATPEEKKSKNSGGSVLVPRHCEAVGSLLVPRQPRETLNDEDRVWSSQDILPGTPQTHTLLTCTRKKEASAKRMARTLRNGETETMEDIQQQNETIGNEVRDNNDSKESDDILITIEDGESPIKTATSNSEESIKLCEFPVGQPGPVIVALQDYATLDSGTFVNDIIIDFYIKFLEHNILPVVDQNLVQIFSTMFYKRLIQSPQKVSKKTAFFETDYTLSVEEKRHYRVAGWTKNVDLFKKKMIIVPICKNSHWFLLIVVNPGALVDPAGNEGASVDPAGHEGALVDPAGHEGALVDPAGHKGASIDPAGHEGALVTTARHKGASVNPAGQGGASVDPAGPGEKNLGSPCIIVLDSLGGEQTSAVNNLRSYLAWECKKRKCIGGATVDELKFSSTEMPAIYPKKPEQNNGVDCGVFLLHYVEKIFENVVQFLSPNLLDLSRWFTMQEVGQKRAQIADLIQQLARKQNSQGIVNYPDIRLEPTRQLRPNQKPVVMVSNDIEDLKSYKNITPSVSNIKAEESKEKSTTTNRFYSHQKEVPNIKQNIQRETKKLPKMFKSSNLIPFPLETTLSRVKCPSPRMRRQPQHSNVLKDESPTRLSFDQILEESEKKKHASVEIKESDSGVRNNKTAVEHERINNVSQSDLDHIKAEKKPDCSDNKVKLMEALKHSLLLLSPERSKLEGSREGIGCSSTLYRSANESHKANKSKEDRLHNKINKINQPSAGYGKRKMSLSSNGNVSAMETSADIFTPGRGYFHEVPNPKQNEIQIQTRKKFKLASKVKCSRFNDKKTKALETFERLMNDESPEESDIFSQED